MQKITRLKRELEHIMKNPPPGISCCPRDDSWLTMDASIMGTANSPYESGIFKIEISITDKYPFEPPRLRFITKVYHPNIDDNGLICLDLLKLPPKGAWRPTVTIEGVLIALQVLLGNPNPNDPLMPDIASEYRLDKEKFDRKAKEWTTKFACQHRESNEISEPFTTDKSSNRKRKSRDHDDEDLPVGSKLANQ